jgi:hypothetical protein
VLTLPLVSSADEQYVQLIIIFISLTKIKDIVENLDELCFQCSCASMFTYRRRLGHMFLTIPFNMFYYIDHIFNIHPVHLSYSCLELQLDRIWWYSPGCMVGVLMSVGVMRRPRLFNFDIQFRKIVKTCRNLVRSVDQREDWQNSERKRRKREFGNWYVLSSTSK